MNPARAAAARSTNSATARRRKPGSRRLLGKRVTRGFEGTEDVAYSLGFEVGKTVSAPQNWHNKWHTSAPAESVTGLLPVLSFAPTPR